MKVDTGGDDLFILWRAFSDQYEGFCDLMGESTESLETLKDLHRAIERREAAWERLRVTWRKYAEVIR